MALLYFGLACHVVWPIPIHPGSRIFGPVGADLTGEMSYFHGLAQAHAAPFLPGAVHEFNAPEGRSTQWALNFSSLPSSTLLWLGSMAIGAVATFGYWAILSFFASAFSMFLFVRWLTKDWRAGLVAGLAFGFWPYVFSTMNQPLGHEWVLVLFAWRMVVLAERPTVRNGLFAGLATALAVMWVQYFIVFVGVAWAVLVLGGVGLGAMRRKLRLALRAQAAGAGPVVLSLGAILLAGVASGFANVPARSGGDLVQYSARPLMYLLPDPNNPILGPLSGPVVMRDFYSPKATASYSEIYLGISVLLLGLVGIWAVAMTVRRRGWRPALEHRPILGAVLLGVSAMVALIFSAPPRVIVLGVQVPMPVEIVNSVSTAFRTTSRFAVIVMLGLAVLAGLGVAEILRRLPRWLAPVAVLVISLVVVGDLWARADYGITKIEPPAVYGVLAHMPAGVYAEYPLESGQAAGGATTKLFYAGYAGDHQLFDGYFPNTDSESRKMELQFLLAPRTIPDLALLGVRYLVVDAIPPGPSRPALYPDAGARIPGAKLIAKEPTASLYRITAKPSSLTSFAFSGFGLPEGAGPAYTRWIGGSKGEIEVLSSSWRPEPVRVSFSVASYYRPRRLQVSDDAGHLLYTGTVPYATVPVSFNVTVKRRAVLHLYADPGPISPHEVNPANPDTRELSIMIVGPPDLKRL